MWLAWQYAAWLAAALAIVAVVLRVRTPPKRWLWVRELAQEGAIVAILYATWQRIGKLSTGDTTHAVARGRSIAGFEHALRFPSEQWAQSIALHSHLIIKAANWYYIVGHAPIMGIFLVWLYVRHREDFARWRTALAVGCIVGELIQVVPVAPPRLTLTGIVDTMAVYGPRVYDSGGAGFAPQLAAMPSLHCVWAITTGVAVFVVAKSRWRWIGLAHALATVLVVVVTGNHYWLDAIVGGALVLVGLLIHDGITRWLRWRAAVPAVVPTGMPVEAAAGTPAGTAAEVVVDRGPAVTSSNII
jgi:hypothetical protein